jgi:TonB family protein
MRSHALILSLFCASLFGQSGIPATSGPVVHVSGTVTQCGDATHIAWVRFDGPSVVTVALNEAGVYEADLSPGVWSATATISATDRRTVSRSRHFRLAEHTISAVVDIYLRPPVSCSVSILTPGGREPTTAELASRDTTCYGEKSFPLPSADGAPFEVELGGLDHTSCSIGRTDKPTREYATYNLLSVQADNVVYHPRDRILEAHGDVVIEGVSGRQRADTAIFHLEDGRAVEMDRSTKVQSTHQQDSDLSFQQPSETPLHHRIRVSEEISKRLITKKVPPEYPPAARSTNVQGPVELRVFVDVGGDIVLLKVVSGDELLAQAAADAVRQWRFKPYVLNGEPIEMETTVTINFRLH